jgi:hypothetical protein
MKTIWKWTLKPQTVIDMPDGAQVLTVQMQHGEPQLWALVDPVAPTVKRVFNIYGTGHSMGDRTGSYIGTFQMDGGSLVFHVFEQIDANQNNRG